MTDYRRNDPGDISTQLRSRLSFMALATLAISDFSERNDVSDTPAWEGLFYFTQDLLDMTSALMEKTA